MKKSWYFHITCKEKNDGLNNTRKNRKIQSKLSGFHTSRGAQGCLILYLSNYLKIKAKSQTSKEWEISNVIGNDAKMMTKYGVKYHNVTMVQLTFQASEHGKMGY